MNWYRKSQTVDDKTLRDLAKRLIRGAWASYPPQTHEERYGLRNITLIIDNEFNLSEEKLQYGDENADRIDQFIQEELEALEQRVYKRREKKLPVGDNLQHLRQALKGRNWEQAKGEIYKLRTLDQRTPSPRDIDDDTAENMFNTLYSAAFGGTYFDMDLVASVSPLHSMEGKGIIKRLSEIKDWKQYKGSFDDYDIDNKYTETMMFRALFGSAKEVPSKIKVYRGVIKAGANIRPGDYVTPSIDYARSYMRGKSGAVVADVLPTDDLIISKIPYDYASPEFVYMPRGNVPQENQQKPMEAPSLKSFWARVNGFTTAEGSPLVPPE